MRFVVAYFDGDGNFRGVDVHDRFVSASPPSLNGKPLVQIDVGCFDSDEPLQAFAVKVHQALRPHPDSSLDDLRVTIEADHQDIATLDVNVPAVEKNFSAYAASLRSGELPEPMKKHLRTHWQFRDEVSVSYLRAAGYSVEEIKRRPRIAEKIKNRQLARKAADV